MYELFMIDFIWTIMDVYFVFMIYSICMRIYHGGYKIDQHDINEITKEKLIRAIDIDIQGQKVYKNVLEIDTESGALFQEKDQKIQISFEFSVGFKNFVRLLKKTKK